MGAKGDAECHGVGTDMVINVVGVRLSESLPEYYVCRRLRWIFSVDGDEWVQRSTQSS